MDTVSTFLMYSILTNLILIAAVKDELFSLPNIEKTLSFVLPFAINRRNACFLLILLLVIFPIIIITFILSSYKRFTFNSYKPIEKSYILSLKLLACCYCINLCISLTEFIVKMAFDANDYFILRASIPFNVSIRHSTTLYATTSLLFQGGIFLSFLSLMEFYTAYKKQYFNILIFIKKNIFVIFISILVSIFYISLFIYLETTFLYTSNIDVDDTYSKIDLGVIIGAMSMVFYNRILHY